MVGARLLGVLLRRHERCGVRPTAAYNFKDSKDDTELLQFHYMHERF